MTKTRIKELIFSISDKSQEEVLEFLLKNLQKSNDKTFVITVNPEIITLALGDPGYEKVIKSADLRTVDGIGVFWAGKVFGKSFSTRIHGVDLMENLCRVIARKPITVGFLGAGSGVADRTAKCLAEKYPGLKVAFAKEEFDSADFNSLKSDILFVAFGSPKQEKWIFDNLHRLDVRLAIGVGGAFDFVSGEVRRAPVWIRKSGFEWFFRLILQPWRIKRQIRLPLFVFEVLKEKLLA